MSENGGQIEFASGSEKGNSNPNIIFESGLHATKTSTLLEKLEHGDLTTHTWNSEVKERLSQYEPQVIAVDSNMNVALEALDHGDYSDGDKKWTWVWLPGSPGEINKKGEVIVVNGDTLYQSIADNFSRDLTDGKERDKLMDLGYNKDTSEREKAVSKLIADGTLGSGIAGVAVLGIVTELSKIKQNRSQTPNTDAHNMSRRKFLKLAGLAAGATVAYGAIRAGSAFVSPIAPNQSIKEIADTVLDMTKSPDLFEENWLDGRTALIAAKTDEVMQQGLTTPDAKAAIVMGNAHNIHGRELLTDREERKKVIREYAEEIVTFYEKALEKFPAIDKNSAVNRMLDWIAQADMLVVTDPKTDRTDNATATLKEHMKYIGTVVSREVMEAVSPLRRSEFFPGQDNFVANPPIDVQSNVSLPATPEKKPPETRPTPLPPGYHNDFSPAAPASPTPLPPGYSLKVPKPPR